jgi:hypothetical protein
VCIVDGEPLIAMVWKRNDWDYRTVNALFELDRKTSSRPAPNTCDSDRGPIIKRKTEDFLSKNPDPGETVRLNVKEGQRILDSNAPVSEWNYDTRHSLSKIW